MWYVAIEIAILLLLALLLGILVGWLAWRRGRVSMTKHEYETITRERAEYERALNQTVGERDNLQTQLAATRQTRDELGDALDDREAELDELRALERARATTTTTTQQPPTGHSSATWGAASVIPAGAGWALSDSDVRHDELQHITGIGPDMEEFLNRHGIRTFDQLANLSRADVDLLQDQLPDFPNRIRSDNWVGQARDIYGQSGYATEEQRRSWWQL